MSYAYRQRKKANIRNQWDFSHLICRLTEKGWSVSEHLNELQAEFIQVRARKRVDGSIGTNRA